MDELGMGALYDTLYPPLDPATTSVPQEDPAAGAAFYQAAKPLLQKAAKTLVTNGALEDNMFAPLRDKIRLELDQWERGTECYPDLSLPMHPATQSTLDTPPDFWFWNESIDGDIFWSSSKEELRGKVTSRLMTSYASMQKFLSKAEYDANYISYNKPELNAESDSEKAKKALLAAFMPDEGDIVLPETREMLTKYALDASGQTEDEKSPGTRAPSINKIKAKIVDSIKTGRVSGSAILEAGLGIEDLADAEKKLGPERAQAFVENGISNMATSDVLRLARAFPTFKIYFIEDEDMNSLLHIRQFDDFYSYSAVKDIRVVRSRKIPADLCVISLININGELDTLAYTKDEDKSPINAVRKFDPATMDTELENPFQKLMLVEGAKIQVRLGYSNNPEDLETVFNGQVVEVGVSDISPDIITVVCQGYAVELTEEHKSGGAYPDTQTLLSAMICSPEVTHFGRWRLNEAFDPQEIRTPESGGVTDATSFFANPMRAIVRGRETFLATFNFMNDPQDDNVYAPDIQSFKDWAQGNIDTLRQLGFASPAEIAGAFEDDRVYTAYQSTIWDIFKEMELRHPGYVASPVPYGNRYTMFFGPPTHGYWSRPMNSVEQSRRNFIENAYAKMSLALLGGMKTNVGTDFSLFTGAMPTFFTGVSDRIVEYTKWLAARRTLRYKPFRNYFFLSSRFNIIANNITASSHGTSNAVELTYMEDRPSLALSTTGANVIAVKGLQKAIDDDGAILTVKADDNIEDRHTRIMQVLYPTCIGEFYARRYACGLLMRSLRDVYKGEIVITGNPKIKPFDMCFLYDDYRDIYGPIEVQQVTHIFSHETGFITEIKPDLVVNHQDKVTQGTFDAMSMYANELWNSLVERTGGTSLRDSIGASSPTSKAGLAGLGLLVGIPTGGIGALIAAYGGYRIVSWMQTRQPLVISPLTQGWKPLIAGLTGFRRDDLFVNVLGKWAKFKEQFGEGVDVALDEVLPQTMYGFLKSWLAP